MPQQPIFDRDLVRYYEPDRYPNHNWPAYPFAPGPEIVNVNGGERSGGVEWDDPNVAAEMMADWDNPEAPIWAEFGI